MTLVQTRCANCLTSLIQIIKEKLNPSVGMWSTGVGMCMNCTLVHLMGEIWCTSNLKLASRKICLTFCWWQVSLSDLLSYDSSQAWPVILDNFVEWLKEKQEKI